MRPLASRLLLLVCALLAVVPATAAAASPPKVTSVAPLKLKIGERLTIRGSGFLAGKNRNTVVFKASGQRAVFAKAASATKTKLVVTVPAKLAPFLKLNAGRPVGTRFQLRVLAKRLSRAYTAAGASPTISPAADVVTPGATGAGGAAAAPVATPSPYEQCRAAAAANAAGDQDADGMANGVELAYGVNPCMADTDGDGMIDGYEYEAARDLNAHGSNVSGRPYPGKRPWPNPLDGSDGNDDFDGDGLTLSEEYRLWWFKGHTFPLTQYSDGAQASGGVWPAASQNDPLDLSHNGFLTDDERDADGDGLSNVVEMHVRGIESWWKDAALEPLYTLRHFSGVDPLVYDSDGDGVGDGADDQDVDGYSNVQEMQLRRGTGGPAAGQTILYVSPYNPCMPNPHSDTCSRYIPVGADAWLPFRSPGLLGDPVPLTIDHTAPPGWNGTETWDGQPGNPNT